jgi:cell wall-associated NlpC family hydrolase
MTNGTGVRLSVMTVIVTLGVSASTAVASPASKQADLGKRAAAAALTQLGKPYVWGQESPATGFDGSGLVVWAYAKAGLPGLPHYTGALWTLGHHVSRQQLRPGDLVFFDGHGHVGIYLGGKRFIDAPHLDTVVRVANLSVGFYASHYSGAVRP